MRHSRTRPSVRFPTGARVLALLGAAALPAQEASLLRTEDGERFLLVPREIPVIHWVSLQPGGTPATARHRPALAAAIAHASRLGSATDRADSNDLLEWEKELRRLPAIVSDVLRIGDHTGLQVTCTAAGLPRVAEMLALRATRQTLPMVEHYYFALREQRARQLAAEPDLAILRRAAGGPSAGATTRWDAGSDAPVTQNEAIACYREMFAPERSIHVLVGGFEVAAMERVLRAVFDGGAAPGSDRGTGAGAGAGAVAGAGAGAVPSGDAASPATSPATSRSVPAAGGERPGSLVLIVPGPQADATARVRSAHALLLELLAGSADAWLSEELRARGHRRVTVRAVSPVPGQRGDLTIAIHDPDADLRSDHPLRAHVEAALDKLLEGRLPPQYFERAVAARQAEVSAALSRPAGLALLLAQRWVHTGTPPDGATATDFRLDPDAFQTHMRQALDPAQRRLFLPRR